MSTLDAPPRSVPHLCLSPCHSPVETFSNDAEINLPYDAPGDINSLPQPGPSNLPDIPASLPKRRVTRRRRDGRKRETCHICLDEVLPSSMKNHLKNVHYRQGTVTCRICSGTLSRKDSLERHLKTCGRTKKKEKVSIPLDHVRRKTDFLNLGKRPS